jgi:hypothetical protein
MTVNLSAFAGAGAQFFDNNGIPLANGKIYSYQAGTTTLQATYTTLAGNIAHSNPINLDSAGRVPAGGEIWLTNGQSYKFVLNDSANSLIATYDNIDGINDIYPINAENVVYNPPFSAAVATNVEAKLAQYPTINDFASVADAISAATGGFKILVNSNVTVQIPTDAATLQTAINALAPNNPQITITLNIASGHLPATGISVSNGDYSQFRITSTDAEVTLSPLFGTGQNFIYGLNAKLPRLACLIDANSEANYGYAAWGSSVGYVEANCGVKNTWGDGCRAYGGSTIYAFDTIWTGCAKNNTTGSGIVAWGSTVFASGSDVSNSMYYGAQAAHGGILVIDNGTANNCFRYNLRATDAGFMSADGVTSNYAGCEPGTNLPYSDPLAAGYGIYAFNGSWIAARDASATNAKHSGVIASNGCTIHARGATLTDCGENGVFASPNCTVDATETDVSGAGNYGYFASGGSTISAASSTANNCGTGVNDAAAYADAASRINVESLDATGCSGIVIRCESGSTINCTGSTITGAGNRSVYAAGASIVNASNCTGTGATNEGVFAANGSTINASNSNFQRGGTTSVTDIVVDNGSFINAAGATGGVSQTVNVLTAEGVIFR